MLSHILWGISLGNIIMAIFNCIGMATGMKRPPMKYYIPAWIAINVAFATLMVA